MELRNTPPTRKGKRSNSYYAENGKDGRSRGCTKYITNPVPTSRNGVQALDYHGHRRGDDGSRHAPHQHGPPFFYDLPPGRFMKLQLRRQARSHALVGEQERTAGGVESAVMWGGATECARGRRGVTRISHYKLEKTEDKGRAPGVGSDNLPHSMESHGYKEDGSQCSTPTTECDGA